MTLDDVGSGVKTAIKVAAGKFTIEFIVLGVALTIMIIALAQAGATAGNHLGVSNPREPGGRSLECAPGEECVPGDIPPATGSCAGVVNIARAELALGVVELQEDLHPRIQVYSNRAREAWCANFVSWVLWQSGNRLSSDRTSANYSPTDPSAGREANVLALQAYFSSQEIGLAPGASVQPGDIVFYDWRRCGRSGTTHTGIVVSYDPTSRTFNSIEGNTGVGGGREGVGTRSRTNVSNSCIIGFGRLRNCQGTTTMLDIRNGDIARSGP